MANWREEIDIHAVLSKANDEHDLSRHEEECPNDVKEALAKELEKSESLKRFSSSFRKAKSIAAVNRTLNSVFDEADRCLVWVGMPR